MVALYLSNLIFGSAAAMSFLRVSIEIDMERIPGAACLLNYRFRRNSTLFPTRIESMTEILVPFWHVSYFIGTSCSAWWRTKHVTLQFSPSST